VPLRFISDDTDKLPSSLAAEVHHLLSNTHGFRLGTLPCVHALGLIAIRAAISSLGLATMPKSPPIRGTGLGSSLMLHILRVGSKASRRPSPNVLTARTATMIVRPGNVVSHQPLRIQSRDCDSILPSSGAGG
jgi:hypothetical protein